MLKSLDFVLESCEGTVSVNSSHPPWNDGNMVPLKDFSDAEFKEFEARLKFKPQRKYGWFHFKFDSIFQDLRRRSIGTGFLGDLRRG